MEIGRSYIAFNAETHVPANTAGVIDITPSFKVPASSLAGQAPTMAVIAQNAGTAAQEVITLAGTYAVGDEVRITLVSNDTSRQLWRKSYSVTVQPGFTAVADIAEDLSNQIALDGASTECPYTSSFLVGVITVVAKSVEKDSMNATVFTNSASGIIGAVRANGVLSEGQPADLEAKGIPADEILSATYDTYRFEYRPTTPQPFIDMAGRKSIEIVFFSKTGSTGAADLKALIDVL